MGGGGGGGTGFGFGYGYGYGLGLGLGLGFGPHSTIPLYDEQNSVSTFANSCIPSCSFSSTFVMSARLNVGSGSTT